MKRLHVHLTVPNLDKGIHFYSQMFGEKPSKQKTDYAKWQLNDPQINFAISTRGSKPGLDHLGIQVSDEDDLKKLNNRLLNADIDPGKVDNSTCCYAESVKSWSFDPAGIPWESFVTMKDAEFYGAGNPEANIKSSVCCSGAAPEQNSSSACC